MRNMSFYLTTRAVRARTKTHTVRNGWTHAQPGDTIRAVVKATGLRRMQALETLATIRITSVERRPLQSITTAEVTREGFPNWTTEQFISWLSQRLKCSPSLVLTFLEYEYID